MAADEGCGARAWSPCEGSERATKAGVGFGSADADATAVKDKRPRTVQKVKRILIDAVREREEEGNVGSGLLWSGGGQEACFRS